MYIDSFVCMSALESKAIESFAIRSVTAALIAMIHTRVDLDSRGDDIRY